MEHEIVESISPSTKEDEELLKFIEESKPNLVVVGAGGSGCNTLNRLFELGIDGVKLVAMNTDAKHLLKIKASKKILLGKQLTKGRGAGSNPEVGKQAAEESENEIKEAIAGANLVFVTCGMGGGTGTGSAPIIAKKAKEAGALVVSVVTLPFTAEGKVRMENALEGLQELKKCSDTTIVVRNDKLLTIAPDLPLNTAFKVSDEVLAGSVKGITEMITKAGLVNVDFADLTTVLSSAGYAVIGLGEASMEGKGEERAMVAVETALNSPMLDADISTSSRALINVIGGQDMSLKEAETIVASVGDRIRENSHIIWGARIEENLKKNSLRVLVVLAGVKFPEYTVDSIREVGDIDIDVVG
ncbi:MAG: cell division protein FtsZ [Candidatus Anstonellales archaeon]